MSEKTAAAGAWRRPVQIVGSVVFWTCISLGPVLYLLGVHRWDGATAGLGLAGLIAMSVGSRG